MGSDLQSFLMLVAGRQGHFKLESGYHGGLWLDLDPLFSEPARVAPYVAKLGSMLEPHRIDGVCGPLLGGAFLAQSLADQLGVRFLYAEKSVRSRDTGAVTGDLFKAEYRLPRSLGGTVAGRRIAIVDDVMSAGSSIRATYRNLLSHGATVPVVGALLVLGTAGEEYFRSQHVAVEAALRDHYQFWTPDSCPQCADGVPLEDLSV